MISYRSLLLSTIVLNDNVFTHNDQSIVWAVNNIADANMLLYPLHYDVINLTSLKITQAFHLLLGFAKNQIIFWDFKI